MKNKYIKVSHISEPKFREIVRLFSEDLSATQIANLTKLNRNTINRYLMLFRERIVKICEETSPLSGEVEVDESYFGASRVRGKRGRGARGKTIEDFKDYLDLIRQNPILHSGCGIGFNRISQSVLGQDDIRVSSNYPIQSNVLY